MKRLLYIFPLLLFMVSCSSYKYNTTRIERLDFSKFKTYSWLPPVDSLSKNYFTNNIARTNILDAANDALEARGMVYSQENPDILFRYITIVNNKSRHVYGSWGGPWHPFAYGMYNPWFYGPRPVGKEVYRLSHVIIEARDRVTNEILWQARGSGEINNPENAINKLPKVVQGIFEQYPVKAVANP